MVFRLRWNCRRARKGPRSAAPTRATGSASSCTDGRIPRCAERQQTLRATIECTYALLETRLQEVFRRLAVFAGSFSLDAAEQVAKAELDEISALVDWSLLKPIGQGRFLILETIREYAHECRESAEIEAVRDRHLDYFLALVEVAEPNLTGPTSGSGTTASPWRTTTCARHWATPATRVTVSAR